MSVSEKDRQFALARTGGQNDKAFTAMMNELDNIIVDDKKEKCGKCGMSFEVRNNPKAEHTVCAEKGCNRIMWHTDTSDHKTRVGVPDEK